MPMQIFLSYARADEDVAKTLSSYLVRRGLSVWRPESEILPGDNVWLRTGEALKKSRAMVVIVSPESMSSEHVRREIEYALGDSNYEGRVFPVEIRPTHGVPWILRKLKTFDGRRDLAKVSESIASALEQVA